MQIHHLSYSMRAVSLALRQQNPTKPQRGGASGLVQERSKCSLLSKQKKLKNLKPIEYEAIADCLVVLSDSEELRIRFRSWSTWVNVVTWVSAAFTNEGIGLDGSQTRIWMVK